jgi:hypothetical protein
VDATSRKCREATFDGADGVVRHKPIQSDLTTFYVSRYRAHAPRPSAALAKRKRGSAQH